MWLPFQPWVRDEIHDRLAGAFGALDVPVIDLSGLEDEFPPGSFEVNPRDTHPSVAVHRAIAQALAEWFVNNLCVSNSQFSRCIQA